MESLTNFAALRPRGFLCSFVLTVVSVGVGLSPHALASVESGRGVNSDGGAAAGQESFKTDLFTGAASTAVPLAIPPGTNGMQPSLGLSYSSQSGSSWVGRGWNLGTQSIVRMTKFGVPSYDDDPVSGDHFALGDDRLVRDDTGMYRPMRESFDRIERVDSGGVAQYWIVHAKNGTTSWYGSVPEARIVDPGSGRTFEWKLNRAEDAHGNYIVYDYATVPGDDGTLYLSAVHYSFAGDPTTSATARSVQFALGARPDSKVIYHGGFRSEMSRRLESIDVLAGGALVSRYDLEYLDEVGPGHANERSLLRRVVRVGADGSSTLPADTHSYSGADPPSWASSDSAVATRLSQLAVGDETGVDLSNGNWRLLDVNGDAAPDVVGTVLVDSSLYASVFLSLKEGNHGVPLFPASGTNNSMPVYRPPFSLQGLYVDLSVIGIPDPYPLGAQWTDYTGDSRPDILIGARDVLDWISPFHSVYRNNGFKWKFETGGYISLPSNVYPYVYKLQCLMSGYQPLLGMTLLLDVNGDGLADLLENRVPSSQEDTISCSSAQQASSWTRRKVYLNNGDGWSSADAGWSSSFYSALSTLDARVHELMAVDVNGDGLVDLTVDDDGDGVADSTTVLVNTGQGWTTDSDISIPNNFRPADLNGDGLVDHVATTPKINTGAGFVSADYTIPGEIAGADDARRLIDLNADGRVDFVEADGSSFTVRFSDDGPPADLLVKTEKVQGGTIETEYSSSGQGSCWDTTAGGCHADVEGAVFDLGKWACDEYPMHNDGVDCFFSVETLPTLVQTAAKQRIDDQNGNVRSDRTRYDLGRYDPVEREFRGFRHVIERPQTHSYEDPTGAGQVDLRTLKVSQFYQLDFMRGSPRSMELYQSDDDEPYSGDDVLLQKEVSRYAVTRGDSPITLLIQSTLETLECDPTLDDILDPTGNSDCPYIDLELSDYILTFGSELTDGLPYEDFRSGFVDPNNRDRSSAYLVMEIGSISRESDAPDYVDRQTWQWHDRYGSVQANWNWGDINDPDDDRFTLSDYAAPIVATSGPPNLHSLPSRLDHASVVVDLGGGAVYLTVKKRTILNYDGLLAGQVEFGDLTLSSSMLKDPVHGLDKWVSRISTFPSSGNVGLAESETEGFEWDGVGISDDPIRTSSYEYDPSNTFTTKSYRGSLMTTTEYDPPGAPPAMGIVYKATDVNGATTTATVDTFGRQLTLAGPSKAGDANPIGVTETTSYDDYSGFDPNRARVTRTTFDGNGNNVTTSTFTDGLGRTIRTERNALGQGDALTTVVAETQYNLLGQVIFKSLPYFSGASGVLGTTTYFDELDRMRYQVEPSGNIVEMEYSALLSTTTDSEGRRRDTLRDGAGLVVAVTEHADTGTLDTTFAYDDLGRLVAVCDSLSGAVPGACSTASDPRHTIVMEYDSMDRVNRLSDPDLGTWTYRYDGRGKLKWQTDARGNTLTNEYDDVYGRLKGVDLDEDGNNDISYTYGDELGTPNGAGRVVAAYEGTINTGFEYDSAGRVLLQSSYFPEVDTTYGISSAYDWKNRVTATGYPDGETINRVYDLMGVDRLYSAERIYINDIEHNAVGAETLIQYGNNTQRVHEYWPDGDLKRVTDSGGTGVFNDHSYAYDLTSKLKSISDLVEPQKSVTSITYDPLGRLTSALRDGQTLSFGYDAIGNLTSKQGQSLRYEHPSKPHAIYDASDPGLYNYDENGNMTLWRGVALSYDLRNRLESVEGTLPTTFAYNRSGERVRKAWGADVSFYLGPDYEIKNGVRFVKTVRFNSLLVARVATQAQAQAMLLMPSGVESAHATLLAALRGIGTADPPVRGGATAARESLWVLAVFASLPAWLGVFFLGAVIAGRQRDGLAIGQAILASVVVVLFYLAPITAAFAAIPDGDLDGDGHLGADDALQLIHMARGAVTPTPEQKIRGDVAPLEASPDGQLNAGDVALLLRALAQVDVDEDGVGADTELAAGASPFRRDTDGDGASDDVEIGAGTNPNNPDTDSDGLSDWEEMTPGGDGYITDPLVADSDGDGYVDSRDSDPTTPAGTEVHWIYGDHLGGSAVVADASGQVVRRIQYDIWGAEISNVAMGPDAPDPAEKFTGQRFDPETGLGYYGARYYDPAIGRFITPDTVVQNSENPQALNRYAYVFNDPINKTDPTGHMSMTMDFGTFDYGYSSFDYGYSSYDITLSSYSYDWSYDWSYASTYSYDLGFSSSLDYGLNYASPSYVYETWDYLGGSYLSSPDPWSSYSSLPGFSSYSSGGCCSSSYSSYTSGYDSYLYNDWSSSADYYVNYGLDYNLGSVYSASDPWKSNPYQSAVADAFGFNHYASGYTYSFGISYLSFQYATFDHTLRTGETFSTGTFSFGLVSETFGASVQRTFQYTTATSMDQVLGWSGTIGVAGVIPGTGVVEVGAEVNVGGDYWGVTHGIGLSGGVSPVDLYGVIDYTW